MRKSRVLLAGVAVAAAGAATSAFTNSNTLSPDNNVAGYGELAVSGVTVSNIAYHPASGDATKLDSVVFTVDRATTTMSAVMTLTTGGSVVPNSGSTCTSATAAGPVHTITCDITTDINIKDFDKTGLTVTSN
jgi:hypothetical protein